MKIHNNTTLYYKRMEEKKDISTPYICCKRQSSSPSFLQYFCCSMVFAWFHPCLVSELFAGPSLVEVFHKLPSSRCFFIYTQDKTKNDNVERKQEQQSQPNIGTIGKEPTKNQPNIGKENSITTRSKDMSLLLVVLL